MFSTVKINGDTVIAVSEIREVRPLTDVDRARMKEELPLVDADKFNTRITTESRVRYAQETIQQLGLPLVEIVPERYVPAGNIESATEMSADDKAKIAADDRYTLKQDFSSRVELKTGKIRLSTLTADRVMNNRNMALSMSGLGRGAK